ncbi:MAG TPA: NAD(P)H nitroreductase [Mycobacterium sp.]|nr:NAD(P)H nitroreductase [Mycobacterium sp.]
MVDSEVIKGALELATRAPSLHNSQPWRWVADGDVLELYADPMRIGRSTDSTGREVLISCGAVLDHLRVAMAAAGWDAVIDRFPNPNNLDHLATLEFRPMEFVTDALRARAEAIRHRQTDRLPFAAPPEWDSFEPVLRETLTASVADLDVIPDDSRPLLADASRLTADLRRYDSSYHAELQWWTTHSDSSQGIPQGALVSESEAERVDVARDFPIGQERERRALIGRDHSRILVLSTYDDSRANALGCGEALSTVLLECTMRSLATCILTHMIEFHASREIVRRLTGRHAEPQLLIRVGTIPQTESPPTPTPRRPLSEVLEIRR